MRMNLFNQSDLRREGLKSKGKKPRLEAKVSKYKLSVKGSQTISKYSFKDINNKEVGLETATF